MTDTVYQNYLQSPEWAAKRSQRLAVDNYTCQCCGTKGTQSNPVQVHHLRYENLGHEDIYRDLVSVCRSCHKGIHRMMCRVTNKDGRRGWKSTVPSFIIEDLRERDLLD